MIEGVGLRGLGAYPDERGFFRQIVRNTEEIIREGWAQASHSMMHPGVAKAWHVHRSQIDWWYVPAGKLKVALHDMQEDSPTRGQLQEVFPGDHYEAQLLKIPPGVAHGCKALSGLTHLIYLSSRIYDPEGEEIRIPHDDPTIAYDGTGLPEIK
jgi:dTDP-4-dehydrorhamnose 3,5-epimerase